MRRLLVVLLLALTSCKLIGQTFELIGDSTAFQLLPEILTELALRHTEAPGDLVIPLAPVPGAALGRDGDYFKTRLAEARAPQVSKEIAAALELLHLPVPTRVQAPDWMLVMLGTNDIRVDEAWSLLDESTELDAAVDRLMLQVPAGTRVLWVVPVAAALRADRRAEFAAGLERAMSRWPALELLQPDPAWLLPDDVHFSAEGNRELAQAIRAATRTAEGGE